MKAKRRRKNWLVGKIVGMAEGVDAMMLNKSRDGVAGTVNATLDPPRSRASHVAFYGLGRGSKDRGRVPAKAEITAEVLTAMALPVLLVRPNLIIERKLNIVLPFCYPTR